MAISDEMKHEIREAVHKQWQLHGSYTPIAVAQMIITALEIYDAAAPGKLNSHSELLLRGELYKARAENHRLQEELAELKRQVSQLRQMLNE